MNINKEFLEKIQIIIQAEKEEIFIDEEEEI